MYFYEPHFAAEVHRIVIRRCKVNVHQVGEQVWMTNRHFLLQHMDLRGSIQYGHSEKLDWVRGEVGSDRAKLGDAVERHHRRASKIGETRRHLRPLRSVSCQQIRLRLARQYHGLQP